MADNPQDQAPSYSPTSPGAKGGSDDSDEHWGPSWRPAKDPGAPVPPPTPVSWLGEEERPDSRPPSPTPPGPDSPASQEEILCPPFIKSPRSVQILDSSDSEKSDDDDSVNPGQASDGDLTDVSVGRLAESRRAQGALDRCSAYFAMMKEDALLTMRNLSDKGLDSATTYIVSKESKRQKNREMQSKRRLAAKKIQKTTERMKTDVDIQSIDPITVLGSEIGKHVIPQQQVDQIAASAATDLRHAGEDIGLLDAPLPGQWYELTDAQQTEQLRRMKLRTHLRGLKIGCLLRTFTVTSDRASNWTFYECNDGGHHKNPLADDFSSRPRRPGSISAPSQTSL